MRCKGPGPLKPEENRDRAERRERPRSGSGSPEPISANFSKGPDGKYRWIYEINLWKDTAIPLLVLKILLLAALFPPVLLLVLSLAEGNFARTLPGAARVYLLLAGIMAGLLAVGYYLVFVPVLGGRYPVVFEMDERGVSHIQMRRGADKTALLSLLGVLAGSAAGNPAAVGANLLAGARRQMHTDFKNVRKVTVFEKKRLLRLVCSDMTRNLIYTEAVDFDFVRGFILAHCKKGVPVKRR